MHAFLAARRTALFVACLALVAAAPLALADDAAKSGYLGVMLQDITPSMAKALQLGDRSGVMIIEVVADSPAARVGLEGGDIILEFKGRPTGDYQGLTGEVRACRPGETVEMVILHNGKEQTLQVELGEREDDLVWSHREGDRVLMFKDQEGKDYHIQMLKELHEDMDDIHVEVLKDLHEDMEGEHQVIIKRFGEDIFFIGADRGYLGIKMDEVSGQMAEYFEVEGGALITEVIADSPAASAGLKAGDVVVRAAGQEVGSPAALHKALTGSESGEEIEVKVVRKGKEKTLKVKLGEMPEEMAVGNFRVFNDGDNWTVRAPKMLFHGKRGDAHVNAPHRELEMFYDHGDMEQLKQELKELKKEMDELKKELKK
jgi:membrane-associated protease RseP (regulator of RpoE activity)